MQQDLAVAMTRFLDRTKTQPGDCNKAWANSWAAAVQHNPTFTPEATSSEREALRSYVRSEVARLSEACVEPVDEPTHERNIVDLSDAVSERFRSILRGGRFRVGTAQKVFNLYLKFLWCFGSIAEPPHCPLDRVVQKRAKVTSVVNWTTIDDLDVYRAAMNSLRRDDHRLAVWELVYGW